MSENCQDYVRCRWSAWPGKNPLIGSYRSAVCKILKLSTFFSSHKILSIKNVLNELINALIDTLTWEYFCSEYFTLEVQISIFTFSHRFFMTISMIKASVTGLKMSKILSASSYHWTVKNIHQKLQILHQSDECSWSY